MSAIDARTGHTLLGMRIKKVIVSVIESKPRLFKLNPEHALGCQNQQKLEPDSANIENLISKQITVNKQWEML